MSDMHNTRHPERFATLAIWLGRWLCALSMLAGVGLSHAAITYFASASNPADKGTLDGTVVPVTPPGGMQVGDLVILVANAREAGLSLAPKATGGQTWTSQAANSKYVSTRIFWARFNGTWSGNPSVAFPAKANGTTVVMHVFRPSSTGSTWAVDAPQVNASFAKPLKPYDATIGGVTTVTDGALVLAVWASGDDNAWTLQTSGWNNAGSAQYRNRDGADASQSVAYKLMPTAGATGGIVNRQTALGGDRGNTSILAFRESALDHIRLEHAGSGLTCTPSAVTVKACADAACSTLYTGSATAVTLSPPGWSANPITFTGSTTAQIAVTTPSTVTLGAAATSPLAANPTRCYVGATATCSHVFADTGFVFSAIPTQTAGATSGTLTIQAVKKADNSTACTGLFTGSVSVGMASQCVNPTACAGRQVAIDGTPIAANPASGVSTYTPVTLNFGTNSTATFTLNYPDVGAVSLSARYLLGGTGTMLGTSNAFVVRPHGFTVTDIKRTVDGVANPAAADATGAAFIKAGVPFTATVTAIALGGAATPNYGNETGPEGVKLTSVLVPGLGLSSNPALTNGTLAGATFSNGIAAATDLAWNEVGVITLLPGVADGDYLGTGDVTGTASVNVGRFHPDHFELSAPALANRTDLAPACVPASSFTYMDEDFQVSFQLTAKGAGNATLVNYFSSATPAQNFAKLATGVPLPASFGFAFLDGATDLSARVDGGIGVTGSWAAGVLDATATLGFTRLAAPDGPYDALKVGVAPVDTDGVALGAFDMDVSAPAGNDHAQVGETRIRFGRLRLSNAHGSELLDLHVPLRLQYWDGAQFSTHVEDSCTTLAGSNIALGNYQRALDSGETAVISPSIAFASGSGSLTLTRPGAGNSGSVDLCIDLGADPPGGTTCAATGAGKAYLQGRWAPGTGWDNDPVARASFGLYRGSRRLIHIREMY